MVDISNWKSDYSYQVSGTREKFWIQSSLDDKKDRFLFKIPKSSYGEIWAEKVAAEIGLLLGLSMMDVQFAKQYDIKGVLLKNFLSNDSEKIDGGELLSRSLPLFNPFSLSDYTIDHIMSGLAAYNMESEFVSICVFDALIANQDRHCENWAIVIEEGNHTFSPIYDNGSSLGFNVKDETLKAYLTDDMRFKGFTNRAGTLIEVNGKRKPKVKVLLNYLATHYPKAINREIDRVHALDYNEVNKVLNNIPDVIMSPLQKEWIMKLIRYRVEWLMNWKVKEGFS